MLFKCLLASMIFVGKPLFIYMTCDDNFWGKKKFYLWFPTVWFWHLWVWLSLKLSCWAQWACWVIKFMFFTKFRDFLSLLLQIFLCTNLFFSLFGTPMRLRLDVLILSNRFLKLYYFFSVFYSLHYSGW